MSNPKVKAMLLETMRLKELPRAGWIRAGVNNPESVAAHSWGTAWLVLALCPDHVNRERALAMAVIHDLPEVHAGDITPHDGVSPETKHRLEEKSLDRLIASHPNATELKGLWEEYATGRSPEARFVKACDKIDMALQATRYEHIQSELELSEFLESALKKLDGSDLEGFL